MILLYYMQNARFCFEKRFDALTRRAKLVLCKGSNLP